MTTYPAMSGSMTSGVRAEHVLRLRRGNGWVMEFSYWPDEDHMEYRVSDPSGIIRTLERGTLNQLAQALDRASRCPRQRG